MMPSAHKRMIVSQPSWPSSTTSSVTPFRNGIEVSTVHIHIQNRKIQKKKTWKQLATSIWLLLRSHAVLHTAIEMVYIWENPESSQKTSASNSKNLRWSKLVPALNLRWPSQHFRLQTQDICSRQEISASLLQQAASFPSPLAMWKFSHNSWLIWGYMQLVYHKWRFEVYIISLPISQPQLFSHLQRIAQKHPWSDEVSFGEWMDFHKSMGSIGNSWEVNPCYFETKWWVMLTQHPQKTTSWKTRIVIANHG